MKILKKYIFVWLWKAVLAFMVLIFISVFQACKFYYQVQTKNKVTKRDIRRYDSLNNYLIVHQSDSAWHVSDPGYNAKMIYGKLNSLPDDHLKYLTTSYDGETGNRYRSNGKKDESAVLTEVHLFLKDSLVPWFAAGDSFQIAFFAIHRAEIYSKDKSRTTVSWLLPGIGGALGILVITLVAINSMSFSINMGL